MRAVAPVLSLRDAEPAFLLEEVEEHDLAHELLGEVHGVDVLGLELVADGLVFGDQFLERRFDVAEQLGVFVEEFLGDGLDAEGVFDAGPASGRISVSWSRARNRVCAVWQLSPSPTM